LTKGALLRVAGLGVAIDTNGVRSTPVRGLSFTLDRAQRLGVIGESGSGKTLTALAVMRLLPSSARIDRGQVLLDGIDLVSLPEREMTRIRGRRVSMVYQDPMSALNPIQTVGSQLVEAIRTHVKTSRSEALERSLDLLSEVGINQPAKRIRQYPHEFSGGMRQRAVIAMAMACNPDLLIADEPTSALDVTTQVRVMDRLMRMAADHGTAVLLITHDLALAASFCDDIQVMYAGRIVETGSASDVRARPLHPYTEALMESICTLESDVTQPLRAIRGQPPSPTDLPTGCPFHPRCGYAVPRCDQEEPLLRLIDGSRSAAACHLAEDRLSAQPTP
jgi:peptide/nickel transport system ATP-binding protein